MVTYLWEGGGFTDKDEAAAKPAASKFPEKLPLVTWEYSKTNVRSPPCAHHAQGHTGEIPCQLLERANSLHLGYFLGKETGIKLVPVSR